MKPRIPNTIVVNGKRMVCRIWDSPEYFDRYTVAFKAYRYNGRLTYPYIGSSEHPFHPQGFGQHEESKEFLTGKRLGKRIRFEDCPPDVQKFILMQFRKE